MFVCDTFRVSYLYDHTQENVLLFPSIFNTVVFTTHPSLIACMLSSRIHIDDLIYKYLQKSNKLKTTDLTQLSPTQSYLTIHHS